MLHKHFLARTVTGVHGAYLRQRNVRFVNHQQKIIREIIYQRKRRFARLAPCQMSRIVFDAGAVAHFVHHFQIVVCALLKALSLQQLVMLIQVFQPFFQFNLYVLHRAFQILARSYIVRRRKNCHMRALRQHFTGQHVNFQYAVYLVVKHFYAHGFFVITGRNNFNNITTYAECTALKSNIVAVILNFHQLAQNSLTVNNLPRPQRKHHIVVFLRCAQAINARHTGNNNYITAFKQRAGGRVAQFINLVVNGSVLFNISIALRNIGFRLIIIVVRYKIFNRVIREERL